MVPRMHFDHQYAIGRFEFCNTTSCKHIAKLYYLKYYKLKIPFPLRRQRPKKCTFAYITVAHPAFSRAMNAENSWRKGLQAGFRHVAIAICNGSILIK